MLFVRFINFKILPVVFREMQIMEDLEKQAAFVFRSGRGNLIMAIYVCIIELKTSRDYYMSTNPQTFLLLNAYSSSWQGFGSCHLDFPTAIPAYRLEVSTDLGQFVVVGVEVAALFCRIKESNNLYKVHFLQLASASENGIMRVHYNSIGMSLACCLFWRNSV